MVAVSVLLPTFNAADCIKEALQSLSDQTFGNFEVIVIDDGSSDGTQDIVLNFPDDRIRLISRDRTGLPSALNRGIREAKGEYLARQDADDRSHPSRLEQQYEYLENHPDIALLGTGAFIKSADRIRRRRVIENPSYKELLEGNRFIHGSVMMRKTAVNSVNGYDELFEYTEDYDLWLRLAERYDVANIDRPLYTLKLHNESIYGTVLPKVKLFAQYAVLRSSGEKSKKTERSIKNGCLDVVYDGLSNEKRAKLHRALAIEYLRYNNPVDARKECFSAFHYGAGVLPVFLYFLSLLPERSIRWTEGWFRLLKNLRVMIKNRR